jgi:hypothetical protein
MGERSAVRPKSGKSVRQSDPALRRPTPPPTAGRKPAARPPVQIPPAADRQFGSTSREAGISQRKTVRGAGQSPAVQTQREALGSLTPSTQSESALPYALDDAQITILIQFFQTLDRWDKEAHGIQTM